MDHAALTAPDFRDAPPLPSSDGEASEPVAPAPAGPLQSPRFVAISRSLQRLYGGVVEQPLSERLQDLLDQIDRLHLRRKD